MSTSDLSTPGFEPPFGHTPNPAAPQLVPFYFSGRGSEYFRIWIVNLLLSIVTLGIYSAWAKVRRTRYFYDNTNVAGTSFEYHGNPIAILKGRIISVVCIVGYKLSFNFAPVLGWVTLAILFAAFPWLVWKSYQFKLFNSSYRGISFGFRGSAGQAYMNYLLLPICTFLTAYLLAPFTHQHIKKFVHSESKFGATHFSFQATVGAFYKTYLIGFGIALVGYIAILTVFGGTLLALMGGMKHAGAGAFGSVILLLVALYVWTFLIVPLFMTMIQNLIWNNTKLGDHQFASKLKWSRMTFIMITNLIGIAVTLGLFTPFAQIRAMKYRLESMSLTANSSLDEFLADAEPTGSVVGEGMSDLLDFDLSL